MAFKDHGHAYVDNLDPKKLPYEGTWYTFPSSVSAATGMLLHRMQSRAEEASERANAAKAAAAAAAAESGNDSTAKAIESTAPDLDLELDADILDGIPEDKVQDMRAEILGGTWSKLAEDDVPEAMVDHMFETLMIWHMFGDQDVAEAYWNDVTGPKAPTDHKPKSSGSTAHRTGRSGKSTRKRASTAATSHSKTTEATPGATS